ncbi:E3 ubiquitin-protein ligase RNF14 [Linum perenne]
MPKGESRDSIVESSHLPSISPPQPQPGSRRPARRRRNASSKKGYVKKSDLGSPISPKIEVGLPSAGEFPAEEGDGVKEKEKEKIPLESEIWASECKKDEVGEGPSDGGGGVADVISVLEELQLAEEPELSADQLRVNDQLQEDELLAMESIYGEKVVILDRLKGLRSFQIHIETKVAKELTITTNLKSKMKTESTSTDDFSYSFKVKFLPPIVLTCTLPRSYPSHKPPCFTISIQWLDSLRISELCSVLDSIWMEQLGQEVIYQWVDWLQTNSLSHLGIHQEMALGPYGTKRSGDRRAISGIVSPDVDVPSLKRYSDEQGIESFLNNLQECCICFSEQAGRVLPCPYFGCRGCMKSYSSIHVSEGTVYKLKCPEAKCEGIIPPSILKQLLGDKEYDRYESLMLQKTLECMSDVVCCPRCEMICIEDEQNFAQCPSCFYSFCSLCRDKRHVGEPCLTPELKMHILQEQNRLNSSQINEKQKLVEMNKINEFLNEKAIARDSKQCPICRMAISRTGGCNKMVCAHCGNFFCYACNKPIEGYEHFRDEKCELFPEDTVREWEEQMNVHQVVGRFRAEQNIGQQGHPCPLCSQINMKEENNNHILCWSCRTHYCYLCRKAVKRASEHFGPKGCKQHSAG